jgi:hypothetical protein
MNHERIGEIRMRRIATGIPAIGTGLAVVLLSGCQVYLHDEGLQKQTAAALAAYKEADVPGAMKATIAAQEKFDAQMLESIVAEAAGARDREIAELLESRSNEVLAQRIDTHLAEIAGTASPLYEIDWEGDLDRLKVLSTALKSDQHFVNVMAHEYREAGGKDFENCEKALTPPAAAGVRLAKARASLDAACATWLPSKLALDRHRANFESRVCGASPLPALVEPCAKIAEAEALTKADEAAAKAIKADLEKARKALADEVAKKQPATAFKEQLEDFKAQLDKADKLAAELGVSDASPSAALAAIQFRETNLCDVLVAGTGKSCSGEKVDAQAKNINEALIGLISGLTQVTGSPPQTDSLTIAVAHLNGLRRLAQVNLDSRTAERARMEVWRHSIVQEIEHLLRARSWLGQEPAFEVDSSSEDSRAKAKDIARRKAVDAKLVADVCNARKAGTRPIGKTCEADVRFANALTAYNLSWAEGRTARHVAFERNTMQMVLTDLRRSQAAAEARDAMLMTALTGLDAFGKGGVTTQTIAELLQALGIAAIASGVN